MVLRACLILAVCSMAGAAWAQQARSTPEGQLQAIREALIEKAMGANTRVSATSWINERGELMEASQFRTDMQVRGVRVLEYMGEQTPKAVVDRLNDAISKMASQPDVRQAWGKQGAVPLVMNPTVFEKYVQDDVAKWARVIKSANIKMD